MKLLVVLAVSALAYSCAVRVHWSKVPSYDFEVFEREFQRVYSSASDRVSRKALYDQRRADIVAHNADSTKTWKRTINEFADYTDAERKAMNGHRPYHGDALPHRQPYTPPTHAQSFPDSVDWRQKGIVSAVKDQGQCGSCWAHASTETIETYVAMASGDLPVLSVMQAASCSPNPKHCGGTGGCGGGTAEVVFSYVAEIGGMAETWSYPYESYWGDNKACRYDDERGYPGTPAIASIEGYVTLPQNNLTALMESIAFRGPLSISVDASRWFDYAEGVYDGCTEETVTIDHAVQLVGYGFDASANSHYWLVRNSWSPTFGEAGYIRVKRQDNPEQFCGIDKSPASGDGCDGGPSQVTVCGSCGILFDNCYPTGASIA